MTKKSSKITVYNNTKKLDALLIVLLALLAIISLIDFFMNSFKPNLPIYISFSCIWLIFFICFLRLRLFKVTVENNQITVRKSSGFKHTEDVSKISHIKYFVPDENATNPYFVRRMKINLGRTKFTIESSMLGYDEMSEFIFANVDSDKIEQKINVFTKKS